MELPKSRIIITGGTSGIGYETAKLLRSKGAEIVICGRHRETVDKTAQELDVHGIVADVSNASDIEALFRFALEKLGGLDVLVNNAGIGFIDSLDKTSVADFTRIWETNVRGLFIAGQAAAAIFVGQKSGNIINIGSTAALRGFAKGSAYVASKFAVSGLTECWRAELRPHNVRVMQVNPSEVVTEFGHKLGYEHTNVDQKLKGTEIAHIIHAMLSMNDVGFIPEASVWATNP